MRVAWEGVTVARARADSSRRMRAAPRQWDACAGALKGQPAFVLGNGPTLPERLDGLAGHFTIGTNRILTRYDPTILMWFEIDTERDIRPELATAECVCFTNAVVNGGQYNSLTCVGRQAEPATEPLPKLSEIPVTGNSGASAAYWAMTLGCSPIYLLGMSGSYRGEQTNFYGKNQHHKPDTLKQLRRTLRIVLSYPNVYPILTQAQLDQILSALAPLAHDRAWYLGRFREAHSRAG